MLPFTFCFTKIMCETLCRFLYFYASLKCMFMQSIMVNRKLCGNFGFSCMLAKTSYLITLRFFSFASYLGKSAAETKKPHFCHFCLKTPLFVANKTLIFSDLYLYRVICTPPPPFLALAGWVSSRPKFFYFLFFLFCKIL